MSRLAAGAIGLSSVAFATAPERAAAVVGRALGAAARSPLALRRRVAETQIAAAFPARSPDWVRHTARAAYLHFGRELALTARLARSGPEAVQARLVNPSSARQVRAAVVSDGSGCVVVTGHLGNWELAGAALAAAGAPVLAVARSQGPAVDRKLAALRRGLGVETLPLEESARGLRSALEDGATVALVADQHAGPAGVRLPFLGRAASTFRGPARLALECGVPLLFGALVREGDRYRALLEEVPAADGAGAEIEVTGRWLARLEATVRAHPEQYFWFHRRWKPGGRPPPSRRSGPAERRGRRHGTRHRGPDRARGPLRGRRGDP